MNLDGKNVYQFKRNSNPDAGKWVLVLNGVAIAASDIIAQLCMIVKGIENGSIGIETLIA